MADHELFGDSKRDEIECTESGLRTRRKELTDLGYIKRYGTVTNDRGRDCIRYTITDKGIDALTHGARN